MVVGAIHHGHRALYGCEAEAGRGKDLDPHPGLLRPRREQMRYAVLVGLLLALPAAAQPEQPVPAASTPVEDVLASSPQITIGNGLIMARIAPPDLDKGFYRGTR